MARRLQAIKVTDYKEGFRFKTLPDRLAIPLKTKKPTKFFVNSMSDLFHPAMPVNFLDSVFNIIQKTPQHIYQILTKRAENMEKYFRQRAIPQNVWLGVTVECKNTKKRLNHLRKMKAKIKFLSLEPLLEDLGKLNLKNIDWAIVGGESGPRARPMKTDWVLKIKEQCEAQDTAFFFKQWGTWGADGIKRNKKANGRKLLNETWDEYPANLVPA